MRATSDDGTIVNLNADGTWTVLDNDVVLPAEPGFRNVSWGVDQRAVLASESQTPTEVSADLVVFTTTLLSMEAILVFRFLNGRLYQGKYAVTEDFSNRTQYVWKRQELFDLLSRKYGKPSSDDLYWHGDLYRDDPREWGMAVATGDLSYFTNWRTSTTDVWLALDGNDYSCRLAVEYSSLALKDEAERHKERQDLDML